MGSGKRIMATSGAIKPNHKAIKSYYEALKTYVRQDVGHESALRSAFQNLLDETGRRMGWTLIPELPETAHRQSEGKTVRPDGTFRDDYYITRGYWEAKDTDDHLETEIKRKIAKGYSLGNTIFEDTRQAYLYQNGQLAMKADITQPQRLADLLTAFFSYTEPAHEDFGKAIGEFHERAPDGNARAKHRSPTRAAGRDTLPRPRYTGRTPRTRPILLLRA